MAITTVNDVITPLAGDATGSKVTRSAASTGFLDDLNRSQYWRVINSHGSVLPVGLHADALADLPERGVRFVQLVEATDNSDPYPW